MLERASAAPTRHPTGGARGGERGRERGRERSFVVWRVFGVVRGALASASHGAAFGPSQGRLMAASWLMANSLRARCYTRHGAMGLWPDVSVMQRCGLCRDGAHAGSKRARGSPGFRRCLEGPGGACFLACWFAVLVAGGLWRPWWRAVVGCGALWVGGGTAARWPRGSGRWAGGRRSPLACCI